MNQTEERIKLLWKLIQKFNHLKLIKLKLENLNINCKILQENTKIYPKKNKKLLEKQLLKQQRFQKRRTNKKFDNQSSK